VIRILLGDPAWLVHLIEDAGAPPTPVAGPIRFVFTWTWGL